MQHADCRVVITGAGLISPLGNTPQALWENISRGQSGVRCIEALPESNAPTRIGGEAREFTASIEDFGDLDKSLKRTIKKGLRLMCREIGMGVAASQLTLQQAGVDSQTFDPERVGTLFGCDYILTRPEEFTAGIHRCMNGEGVFHMEEWGELGLPQVAPLWLLKYLPNMPASHVAIYNDLRGPSNSLTMREASSNAAIAEAVTTIRRGVADAMLAGATGTRIHPLRSVHTALQEVLAECDDPAAACRPFDKNRLGMVLGEGAGCFLLESLESAGRRSAHILGEVVGYSSSTVANRRGVPDYAAAIQNVLRGVLQNAGLTAADVGHIHAHGLATEDCDRGEAHAIRKVFGEFQTPVVAAKSYMGNLGAGSGMVEILASLKALEHNHLFPILNYRTADPEAPVEAADPDRHDCGNSFINVNVTPLGQASAVMVRRFDGVDRN
jgi:3-oxoacyl-[acyl-carrier-protein] synthase II